MQKIFYILLLLIFLFQPVFSQNKADKKNLYKTSKTAFDNENYKQALELLLQYDSLYPGNYEIIYRIGACYLNTEFKRKEAIPYLERVLKTNEKDIPPIAFKDLAYLYHLDYQLDKSEQMYRQYLSMVPKSRQEVERHLASINKAKQLIADSLTFRIENVGLPINTDKSEIMPYVSADESAVYYQEKESSDFYLVYRQNDKWQERIKLDIPNLKSYKIVRFAGISPDGEQIFVQLGDSNNTDLYYGKNFLKTCNQLILFNENINSPYHEGSVSVSPDGNYLYFSSNRPGGYGGYDIYVSKKDTNGEWGLAQNLGPIINTEFDELAPFIHPSLSSLFFSSNGHETMGGFDIFEAKLENNQWNTIENIGYPINTTYDDMSYSVTAKGNSAYLSSTRNDKTHHFDIYKVHLKESIPLTLVKGKILAGNPPLPVKASIQVIDKLSQKPLKYIYNPNPKTGQYLLIFPPGKDYDMIIKAEGYNPYIINIYIPNQTYFYENFQEITLTPISVNSLGKTIGEEIQIKNTFYDIYKDYNDSLSKGQSPKNYDKLLSIIEELIAKTDTLGLNVINDYSQSIEKNSSSTSEIENNKDYDKLFSLVEEAIESTDSVALKILDENVIPNISYQNRYFYSSDASQKNLEPIVLNNDTIYAIAIKSEQHQTKDTTESTKLKQEYRDTLSTIKQITDFTVYFEKSRTKIDTIYHQSLTELAHLITNNPNLYIRITAYANPKEGAQLAVSRASEIRNYLVAQNTPIEKTKTVANINRYNHKDEGQKVELNIFESFVSLYQNEKFSPVIKIQSNEFTEENKPSTSLPAHKEEFVYKVQIASGADYLLPGDKFFQDENVSVYEYHHLYKYVIGEFPTSGAAYRKQLELIDKGFEGAFVVKFKNGIRVD